MTLNMKKMLTICITDQNVIIRKIIAEHMINVVGKNPKMTKKGFLEHFYHEVLDLIQDSDI